MINFMNNNRNIIGTLSIIAIFAVWANAANASEDSTNNLTIKTNIEKTVQEDQEATKVALSVSRDKMLEKYENKHNLTDEELKEVLMLVGFKGKELREAWAIAKRESNGRPFAFNGNIKTGDSSYGIFQINMIGKLGPDRREKFDLKHNADLFNPVINAKIAYHMSRGGDNWISWKGMTPRAKEWLEKFPN